MKYSLLVAILAALTMTACEHKPGDGKPGQYPPSLYSGKDHGVMGETPPAAKHDQTAKQQAPESAPAKTEPEKAPGSQPG